MEMIVRLSFLVDWFFRGINLSVKEAKKKNIVNAARTLFMQRGINNVTIRDIAIEVGVGEATVYRAFSKKQNIAVAVAMAILEEVSNNYFHLSRFKTGYEKIESFYSSFLHIFKEHPEYYKYISEFDLYIVNEVFDGDEYERAVLAYYTDYSNSYLLGIKDGTLKVVDNIEVFYLTTTHSLLELCKKLATDAKILNQDVKYKTEQVATLISIFLDSIKK